MKLGVSLNSDLTLQKQPPFPQDGDEVGEDYLCNMQPSPQISLLELFFINPAPKQNEVVIIQLS